MTPEWIKNDLAYKAPEVRGERVEMLSAIVLKELWEKYKKAQKAHQVDRTQDIMEALGPAMEKAEALFGEE
jgi:hypothetical protein